MKKVVISPRDTKAIAFFEELNSRKDALRKKVEAKLDAISSKMSKSKNTGAEPSAQ